MAKNTETTQPVEQTEDAKAPKIGPCSCFTVQIGTEDDGTPTYGACGADTRREFAPGHDAKLKSVLIKLYRAGQQYVVIDGGMRTERDPSDVATERGWGKFLTDAKPKKTKSAKQETKPETPAELPEQVLINVGRGKVAARVVGRTDDELTVEWTGKNGAVNRRSVPVSKTEAA